MQPPPPELCYICRDDEDGGPWLKCPHCTTCAHIQCLPAHQYTCPFGHMMRAPTWFMLARDHWRVILFYLEQLTFWCIYFWMPISGGMAAILRIFGPRLHEVDEMEWLLHMAGIFYAYVQPAHLYYGYMYDLERMSDVPPYVNQYAALLMLAAWTILGIVRLWRARHILLC